VRRTRSLLPCLVLLVVALGLGGCGVSATDGPVDIGDPAAGRPGTVGNEPLVPPGPEEALQPVALVRDFLKASAGGGAQANDRVKQYLNEVALEGWTDPTNVAEPALLVVRVVGDPSMGVQIGDRVPVTVQYQQVGMLTDRGRVDELANLPTQSMTFWVTADDQLGLRINEIEGWPVGQLLLSQDGLTEFYRMQPIYFWDRDYKTLVPDLRYVPRTITREGRADRQLAWLVDEPSPWLSGVVQSLPAGTTKEETVVPDEDGTLQVRLTAAVPPGDDQAAKRLMFQLLWSLADGESIPEIGLYVDGQFVDVTFSDDEFRSYLNTWSYRGQPERYDIVEGVVQPIAGTPPRNELSVPANASVVSAAIRRDPAAAAAFVTEDEFGRRTLQLVTNGESRPIDLQLPANSELGRPFFVPGTDVLLVPTGGPNGRLMAVSVSDGTTSEVATGGPLPGVSAAAVSPDGRRVAVVANGALYVAPLTVSAGTVTIGSATRPRQLLAGQLTATTVTWTAESWLLVAGTRGDDQPALWRVTSDGVVADDLSGTMGDLLVDDLVCWPDWRNSQDGDRDVRAVTNNGVYTFVRQFSPEPNLIAPFFG